MAHIAMLLESSSLAAESTSRVCGVTGMSGESTPFALILARFPAAGIQNPTILGSETPWFFWGDFWPPFQEPPELRRAIPQELCSFQLHIYDSLESAEKKGHFDRHFAENDHGVLENP